MSEEITVETVEEIEDNDIRRQAFLRQVYDRYESTREALVRAKADPNDRGQAQQVALAHLADLLGQLRPMLEGTPYWSDVQLARLETGDGILALEGLRSIFKHRDGIEMAVERDSPGRGRNTVTGTEHRPLPVDVIEAATNTLGEFMHSEELLVAHTEEATARDDTPL